MGLWTEFAGGLLNGVAAAAARPPAGGRTAGVEALCRQIGWSVDERTGTGNLLLHFRDPIVGVRKVLVAASPDGTLVTFAAVSVATVPPGRVPPDLLLHLLGRNADLALGAWGAGEVEGRVNFRVTYSAGAAGLDAGVFKAACEELVREARGLDAKLQAAGLL
jgi:hypothetical protein